MGIKASKESASFTVNNSDPLIEIALAMAELNRNWGDKAHIDKMKEDLSTVVESARNDPSTTQEELGNLELRSETMLALEELATVFRSILDESDELLPSFEGPKEEAIAMLKSYASALGARLDLS